MKKYVLIASILTFIYADPVFYFSPGIQIGVNSTGNFFFSSQITIGAIPFEETGIILGTTFGRRYYYNGGKFDSYGYLDGQVCLAGILGLGIGTMNRTTSTTYYDNSGILQQEIIKEKYTKYKFWAGAIGLLSYDFINSPSGQHNFGLMGVIPVPFGEINP